MPEQVIIKIVGQNQYSVSLGLNSALGTIQRIQNTIDHIKDDLSVTRLEVDKSFSKEAGYQTKKAEYDVLAPLIETETDLDIIDQALRQFHEKGKEKQEQLSFELD